MTERVVRFDQDTRLWAFCDALVREAVAQVPEGRRAGVLVSGGTTFLPLYEEMGDLAADLFLADERMVLASDRANSQAMIRREWVDRLANPQVTLMQVPEGDSAGARAAAYAAQITDWEAKGGVLVAALLGVGTDGHTASLFPGQLEVWQGTDKLVIATQAELPPLVERITVTPALLNRVPRHICVLTGGEKTQIAHSWLVEHRHYPISELKPTERIVLLDAAAARDLPADKVERA